MLNKLDTDVFFERLSSERGLPLVTLSLRTQSNRHKAIKHIENIGRRANVDSLVERVALGDAMALGELYDAHHVVVRAFARRMLADAEAAEDLVQEVFIAAPKALRRFRGESTLRTFLLSVTANRCRRYVRSALRRTKASERFADELPDEARETDVDARRRELRKILEGEIAKLPFDHRVALVLCSIEERSSSEVATILGIPEGTVRTRHFHARQKLRELMKRRGYS